MKKGTRYHNSIWEDGVHLRWTAVHGQVKINELTLSGRRIKVKTVINTIKSQTQRVKIKIKITSFNSCYYSKKLRSCIYADLALLY